MKSRKMTKIVAAVLCVLLLAGILAGCGGGSSSSGTPSGTNSGTTANKPDNSSDKNETKDDGKVYELSLSTHDPATSNKTIYFQQWADEINEASGGRLNITIYSGGSLASGTAALDALRTGVCDIAWIYPQYFSGQFPLSEVVSLPIGISSVPQGVEVLYSLYEKYPELQEEVSEFVPLMIHTNPTNKICTTEAHPVYSVSDLKGLTYRASAGMASDLLIAWGATPIQMAPGDIYQAVQKGTVDGFVFDWSGMVSFGLQEVTGYLVTYPVYCGPYYLMMNKDSFNKLPEDLQQIILEHSGKEASLGLAWTFEGDERSGYETCVAAGCVPIDLTEEAAAEFASYYDGIIDTWKEKNGSLVDVDAYVADAQALADQYYIEKDEVNKTLDELGW
ncbi:MAG: TRAP transporter substrate-binding protein [Oscillospiraceae bacterium]